MGFTNFWKKKEIELLPLAFFRMNKWSIMPRKAYNRPFEDAAYDLYYPGGDNPIVTIYPGQQVLIGTGLKAIIPEGYWLKFHERSGLANKKGIKVSAGVIDPAYTGELKVILLNASSEPQIIEPKTAICQFTVEKIIPCNVFAIGEEEFNLECEKRTRKANGFGSSDKR